MRKTFHALLPLLAAIGLSAYYYAVSADFRFLFLDGGGAMIIRVLRRPLERDILFFFAASAALMYAGKRILEKFEIPEEALLFFCIPSLFVFSFAPQAARFPELIPVAAVILPAASISAFSVFCFMRAYEKNRVRPRPASSGRDWRPAGVFAVFLIIFSASGYHINETTGYHRGDEGHYLTMARSIAEDFDLDIRNQIPGYTPSMRLRVHISPHSPEGYGYSWHPPGLSFVFAPFFRLSGEQRSGERGSLFSLYAIGAFLACLIYLAARDASGSKNIGLFSAAALMLSSPMWLYSVRAYPMMPGGLCMLYCWMKLKGFKEGPRAGFVLFNLLMAWLAWLHDTFLPAYGILGLTLFIFWLKDVRNKKLLITLLLQALNLAVFVFFRFRWYGSNFFGQHGGLFDFWPGLFGAWFDFFRGMIFASPVHLLAFVLLLAYVVKKRDVYSIILLLLYMSVYIPGSSAGTHWTGGSSHPGRRLAPCIPLAAAPLGFFMARVRKYSFCWLVVFLAVLSVSYMSYFMIFNPHGFTRPLSELVLAEQLFRPLDFHLPAFGTSFHNFPWVHFIFALANIAFFILFWVFLTGRERRASPAYMSAGMLAAVLWALASIAVMKSLFETSPPVPKTAAVNFSRTNARIAEPVPGPRLFVYAVDGAPARFAYSHRQKGLPHHLDLSRGLYELEIKGAGPPEARAEAEVIYVRRGIRLAKFPVAADETGRFDMLKHLYLPAGSDAVSIFLDADSGFEAEKTVVAPAASWFESLAAHVSETGSRGGLFRYSPGLPEAPGRSIPAGGFKLRAGHAEESLGNMLDGNPGTRWTPLKAQEPGMYFEVDMGRIYSVRGIRLDQGVFWKDWPRGLLVHASVDGENWKKVYDDSDSMGGYVYGYRHDSCFRNMENCVRAFFGPVDVRWLRVEQTGRERIYWWSVAGFEVLIDFE